MADERTKVVLDDQCPLCKVNGKDNKLVLFEDGEVECAEGHSFGPSSSSTASAATERVEPIEMVDEELAQLSSAMRKVPSVVCVLPDRGAVLAVRISENDYRDLVAATRDKEDPAEMFQRTLEYGLHNGWFSGCYVSK